MSLGGTAQKGTSKSRRLLECVDDNFATDVIEEPARRGLLLDLVLSNRKELVEKVIPQQSLGCNDHMVEFQILMAVKRSHSKLTALDFSRADFGLFRT